MCVGSDYVTSRFVLEFRGEYERFLTTFSKRTTDDQFKKNCLILDFNISLFVFNYDSSIFIDDVLEELADS
jgi:hypothetical protein